MSEKPPEKAPSRPPEKAPSFFAEFETSEEEGVAIQLRIDAREKAQLEKVTKVTEIAATIGGRKLSPREASNAAMARRMLNKAFAAMWAELGFEPESTEDYAEVRKILTKRLKK